MTVLADPLLHAEIMMSNSMTLSLILRRQRQSRPDAVILLAAPALDDEDILIPNRCLWLRVSDGEMTPDSV